MEQNATFSVGQIVRHELFGYRGVVIDVDPMCMASDTWYEQHARSRPPKNAPWYHVLVDEAVHQTYVAQRNLRADESGKPIRHPELDQYFGGFTNGIYRIRRRSN